MAYFTHQWSRLTVEHHEYEMLEGNLDGQLNHSAGNHFRRSGIRSGDQLFIISWSEGQVRLHGRFTVDRVTDFDTAAQLLGTDDLWDAKDHVVAVANSWTDYHFDLVVPDDEVEAIRFLDKQGREHPPAHRTNGRVDHQTFRNVRRITPATAEVFETLMVETP